jgi:cellulose biosynthesis protein BcsQ
MTNNSDNCDIKTKLSRLVHYEARNNINPNPIVIYEENPRTRHGVTTGRCVHFIPGFPELATLTKQMTIELDESEANLNNCSSLKHLIQKYADRYHYDLVLIDLGPDLYTVNSCALWSSDYVLIPCTADIYSAMSFRLLADVIFPKPREDGSTDPKHAYHRFGSRLQVVGFLPNRVKVLCGQPTKPQSEGISKLSVKFESHLGEYCKNRAEGQPCFIPLLGGDLTNNETFSLIELCIRDGNAKARLTEQLDMLVEWINLAIV